MEEPVSLVCGGQQDKHLYIFINEKPCRCTLLPCGTPLYHTCFSSNKLFAKCKFVNTKYSARQSFCLSRHTVVCRAAQEAGVPPVSILTGRKKTQFSHLCSSVIPYPIGTKFAREVPASKGSLHTKFEENRSSHFPDTSEQNFVLISSFFSSSTSSFRTLRKIRHKTRMRARIGLKFGTLKVME